MQKLLILCTGNTCRSPMAGLLAKELFKKEDKHEIEVRTAGLSAFPGSPASNQAMAVMEENGLDLTNHKAALVTQELVDWADLILTMTLEHKQRLLAQYPGSQGKAFTLREIQLAKLDIADPFGGTLEDYRKTAQEIEEALRVMIQMLQTDSADGASRGLPWMVKQQREE